MRGDCAFGLLHLATEIVERCLARRELHARLFQALGRAAMGLHDGLAFALEAAAAVLRLLHGALGVAFFGRAGGDLLARLDVLAAAFVEGALGSDESCVERFDGGARGRESGLVVLDLGRDLLGFGGALQDAGAAFPLAAEHEAATVDQFAIHGSGEVKIEFRDSRAQNARKSAAVSAT